MITITDTIYLPFLSLSHLKIAKIAENQYTGIFDSSLTFSQLVRFAQFASSTDPNQSHCQITQAELLAVLHLLPQHYIESLSHKIHSSASLSQILMNSIPAATFGAAVYQYLKARSQFEDGDQVTYGSESLQWVKSRFLIPEQEFQS